MLLKNISKIVLIFLVIILLLLNCSPVKATSTGGIISGADDFIDDGKHQPPPIQQGDLKNLSDSIYNILLVLGIAIAGILGVVLGIQFMTGSVEQKSKVKETLLPYVVGCVVIFGAFGIWKLVITILSQV